MNLLLVYLVQEETDLTVSIEIDTASLIIDHSGR